MAKIQLVAIAVCFHIGTGIILVMHFRKSNDTTTHRWVTEKAIPRKQKFR